MSTVTQTCYRHPDRETAVQCSNCGRPICPSCMTPTPVGMRCPECTKQKTQVRTMRDISNPTITVTIALIAINVLLWIPSGNFGFGTSGINAWSERLVLFGPYVADGEWWRLITGGFQHASLFHIGFNMYLLYVLGQMLEPALGRVRFGLVYFAALLAGSFGSLLLSPTAPTLGASGAVFGLMGFAVLEMRARGMDPFAGGIFGSLGGLIVINLALSFLLPGISIGGHVGGLVGGGLCALALAQIDRRRLPAWVGYAAIVVVGVVAFAGCLAVAGQPTGLFGGEV